MAPLFSFHRSSTQSNKSNTSEKTLVGSYDGRSSPQSEKRVKQSAEFDVIALPDGSVVRVKTEGMSVPDTRQNFETILEVAKESIRMLRSLGVHSCAAGDLAARVYGATRVPEEVDLFLLTDKLDYAQILRRLIFHNPKFFLVPLTPSLHDFPPALDGPSMLDQALYYRTTPVPIAINLHLPPTPVVPYLTSADIHWRESFPLLPLPLVLLEKLRTWTANRYVPASREITLADRRRQWAEHGDLETLMGRVVRSRTNLRKERICAPLFESSEAEAELERWVREYLHVYPDSRTMWAVLGIRLPEKGALSRTQSHSSGSTSSLPRTPVSPQQQRDQPAHAPPRPSFSSDHQSVTSRPSLSFSRTHTPIPESPHHSPTDPHPRPQTPSRQTFAPPPLPPLPPPPVPKRERALTHPPTVPLRSRSPFLRKKSSAKLKERAKEESYFDWDD
ncbi:hypothetical protein CALVIDRAFT_565534 [Calocera viscosa TUFC12733]|uniref:Nucleotidyltransferase n=1 Tax=Calocera viscosa (strain TUFC12733) TaxID=1330018 RepID=A0A167KB85_CALVF|nr:hypothetical protein CALVIDRAFT_565534 [Calocera viscosa TUFC12733]